MSIIYQNNCYPGIVDSDSFCFRYNDKDVNDNEQYLYDNYWREQIDTYGQIATYYVNAYNVLSADNIYGEDPTQIYATPIDIIMAINLSENATTLAKFGLQSDDEITAYVHLSSFADTFSNAYITFSDSTTAAVFPTQYNQVQPKAGDVFVLSEYGRGRPGTRGGKQFEVTEILDEDISQTNQLGGHYVWILKAKRFDFSYEPGLSAEVGSDQVYDQANLGILSGGSQLPSPSKKYNEKDPLTSIDQVGTTVVFDMTAMDNTDVYGSY